MTLLNNTEEAFLREIRWLSYYRMHSDIHQFQEHRYSGDFERRVYLHIDWMLTWSDQVDDDLRTGDVLDKYFAEIARIFPFLYTGKAATRKLNKRFYAFVLERLSETLSGPLERAFSKHFPQLAELTLLQPGHNSIGL